MITGSDGYIYFWNKLRHNYMKACDVEPEELPYDVKKEIRSQKEEARQILEIPDV
jgi:hypothetical protein